MALNQNYKCPLRFNQAKLENMVCMKFQCAWWHRESLDVGENVSRPVEGCTVKFIAKSLWDLNVKGIINFPRNVK